ncbi:DUF1501 domain-containing protein [Gimesia maris]|uniref:DUF1501 domain-containing protein n=1 Tax=Gimesia maris TaxID=122 RepID=UPI00118A091C|nr:DUF1501 domain-containing protein [Gimesia maris]QDU15288.1 hypothetical protein CA11_31100 [Gimesia maris]|tara:strand:- start:14643 stop:16007 length:1365 start_codon:yes stop_codon:yes gene_type:complete
MRYFPSSAELSRRQFIQLASLGLTGGLSLGRLTEAVAGLPQTSKQQSVVMVYLPGGPTQFETFDPKPDAPSEIRGSFAATQSRVPGVQFCELLPELSTIADKFSVVRTLVGMENRHESFQCYTGRAGGRTEDGEPAGGWPSFGSIVSQLLGPGRGGMIPYVDAAPRMSYNPYNNNGSHLQGNPSWPGFTGYKHVPFALEGEVKSDLILNGIDLNRFNERRVLLETVKQNQSRFTAEGIDDFQDQAFQMLSSGRFAAAMDLEQEPQSVRDRYGKLQKTDPSFGGAPQSPQHLLLARRLVEAGVRCVSVAFGAWDWHANREGSIEYLSRKYLPVFDHSLAVFLQDLEERGLLEQTTVIVWGEFGRTPRINAKGGRDHWPGTQSVLLAGGGIQGGRVVGQTDRVGGVPLDRPVHVQEIFATLYQNLGINIATAQITDLSGRPRYLIDDDKQPIPELY